LKLILIHAMFAIPYVTLAIEEPLTLPLVSKLSVAPNIRMTFNDR